jgi:hypothetical protein
LTFETPKLLLLHVIVLNKTELALGILIIFSGFSKCGVNIDPNRIKIGTGIGAWPWMGSLGTYKNGNWTHRCGASLIDDTRVITAAHCVISGNKVIAR